MRMNQRVAGSFGSLQSELPRDSEAEVVKQQREAVGRMSAAMGIRDGRCRDPEREAHGTLFVLLYSGLPLRRPRALVHSAALPCAALL